MTEVRWLQTAEEYASRAEDLLRAGALPILAPGGARRRQRWERILAWHLAATTVHPDWTPESGGSGDTLSGKDIVVALDPAARPAAQALGAAIRRPVHEAVTDDGVERLVSGPVRSVILLGMPGSLPVRRIHRLNETLPCPWGVLTATDPAGLSFVVSKLLVTGVRPGPAQALIDMRQSRMRQTGPDGRWPAFDPLDPDQVDRWLSDRDWDALGLDAHGEGAHVNLGRVVGCGLIDGDELDRSGTRVAGCVDSPPGCKRVTSPDQRILALRDLRARELFLVSCNGFAVAGDMYPSTLSCVLSAAEGYPARILTTDRLTAVDHWVAPLLMRLSSIRSAGQVREFANDLGLRLTGVRPWVLFGDPSGADEPLPVSDVDGSVPDTSEPRSVVAFRHNARPGMVLGLAGDVAGQLVLGEHQGVLALTEPATGPWRLTDRSAEWSRLAGWMATLARRVRRTASLEQAARRLLSARHIEDAGDALTSVRDARLRLEYVAQLGLRECEDVRRRGVWDPVLTRQAEAISLCVAAWDRAMATLLADHLFEGVEQAFADGWPILRRGPGEECPRCGTRMAVTVLGHPLDDEPDTWMVTCPVCGPSAAHRADGPRVRVAVPDSVVAGHPTEIVVSTSDTRQDPLVDNGVLRCELVDKGWGAPFHRESVPLASTTYRLRVDVPPTLRSDLHTVRAVWVRGLEVASCRARVPGFATGREEHDAAQRRTAHVS